MTHLWRTVTRARDRVSSATKRAQAPHRVVYSRLREGMRYLCLATCNRTVADVRCSRMSRDPSLIRTQIQFMMLDAPVTLAGECTLRGRAFTRSVSINENQYRSIDPSRKGEKDRERGKKEQGRNHMEIVSFRARALGAAPFRSLDAPSAAISPCASLRP